MAGLLEERNARYNARRAAGEPHPNPFAGLLGQLGKTARMIPEGTGKITEWGGGLLESAYNGAINNYQNSGGLLSENPLNVDRSRKQATIDNSPEARTSRILKPVSVDAQRLPPVKTGLLETPTTPSQPTPEQEKLTPEQDKLTPESTFKDAEDAKMRDAMLTARVKSEQMAIDARNQLEQEGASPEELKGWDKFVDEYDLGAIGAALLASNDGTGNLATNLGKALMVGRSVSERMKDKDIETARYNQEQAEAKIEAVSKQNKRANDTIQGQEALQYESQRADATTAMVGIAADRNAVQREKNALNGGKLTETEKLRRSQNVAAATTFLSGNPTYDIGGSGKEGVMTEAQQKALATVVGENFGLLIDSGALNSINPNTKAPYTRAELMGLAADRAAEDADTTFEESFFPWNDDAYVR